LRNIIDHYEENQQNQIFSDIKQNHYHATIRIVLSLSFICFKAVKT